MRAGGLRQHAEPYDDVGEVGARVVDLEARWREEDGRVTARVDAEGAYLVYEAVVNRPVEEVWRVQTDPREQPSWRVGLDRYDSDSPGGARGVGTQAHCVHGRTTIHQLPPVPVDGRREVKHEKGRREGRPFVACFERAPNARAARSGW